MKRKLLLAALCVVGALGFKANAQTDVTSTYLSNPGFETSPIFDGTAVGTANSENATPTEGSTLMSGATNVYEISGWTQMTTDGSDFARVFTMPYNTTLYVKGNDTDGAQAVTAPVNGSSVATENGSLLFIEANWCQNAVLGVKKSVELPAGVYKLSFDTYVTNAVANASSLCGVKIGGKTTYKWASAVDTWMNQVIYFVVEADDTEVEFSLGYKKIGNVGGGTSAFLFVDNLKLEQVNSASPAARSVDVTNLIANADASAQFGDPWAVTNGLKDTRNTNNGYDGVSGFFEPSQWGSGSWSGEMYEELSALPVGLYTLKAAVQSAAGVHTRLIAGSSNSVEAPANGTEQGTIAADGSVVAAGSGVAGWNFVSTTEYVTNGALKIGVYTQAWANQKWTNIDNFTLSYISYADMIALPLPDGENNMTAGTWYYFDVDQAGDYTMTAGDDLANIVYTTDGQDVYNDAATSTFTATANLTATRYYVKSSSAQTLGYEMYALDLTTEIDNYNTAVSAATAIDPTTKMASSILSELQGDIETYGNIDTTAEPTEQLQADLVEATGILEAIVAKVNVSIASYAIIASGTVSTSDLAGWTCTNTNTFHINTWSDEGDAGNDPSGMTTPFIENWRDKKDNAGLGAGTISYTLEGLEPGEVYYAQALIRSYNERNSDAPNGPNFFINDVETSLPDAGTTFTYNNMSGIYATLGGTATVGADGKLTLGAVIANDANYNWVAFKNVSIRSLQDAYNAEVAAAEALNGTIPAAAYTAMMNTINTDYSTVTVDNIQAINALVTTYSALVAPYAEFGVVYNAVKALYNVASYVELEDGAHTTLGTALDNAATDVEAATTVDAINQVNATLKAAGVTYAGAADPTDEAAPFDLTFMLTNPDLSIFTKDGAQPGWYNDQTFPTQNSQVMQSNNSVANTADNTKFAMYEYWSNSSCATSGYTVYTKVTLPAGTYKMDALCMTGWGYAASSPDGARNITFSAGNTDGTQITTSTLEPATLDFVQEAESEVKIGLKAHEGNTCNWMGIGYVELYKVPAKAYAIDETEAYDYTQSGAGDVTLTRTIKEGVNTLVLPFGMTQAEVEETFGAGSVVYVVDEFDGKSNIKFKEQSGIVANEPCLLKATVASGDEPYVIEGRTLVASATAVVTTTVDGLSIIGTYAASTDVANAANNFILYNGDFYLVDTGGVTVKNTRAYFHVDSEASIKALNFIFGDEEATAIAGIGAKKAANEAMYNVAGQRVGAAYKGIVIKNGKKYLQK